MRHARAMAEGSLREIGVCTLGVDKVTKSRLKRLAGDTPLCVKFRELVEEAEKRELPGGGGQVPLPGQERMVSPNNLAAIGAEVRALSGMVQEVLAGVRSDGLYIETKLEPLRLWLTSGKVESLKPVKATGETEQLELRTS